MKVKHSLKKTKNSLKHTNEILLSKLLRRKSNEYIDSIIKSTPKLLSYPRKIVSPIKSTS